MAGGRYAAPSVLDAVGMLHPLQHEAAFSALAKRIQSPDNMSHDRVAHAYVNDYGNIPHNQVARLKGALDEESKRASVLMERLDKVRRCGCLLTSSF